MREIVDTARRVGESAPMPRKIVGRLVRFQLLDNIRNVGQPYGPDDVRKADFSIRRVRDEGTIRSYAFTGSFASEKLDKDQGEKVGNKGRIDGRFDVDLAKTKIVRFRAFAQAEAWGDVKRTQAPEGKYTLVFALVDADDDVSRAVPPVWHAISPVWTPHYADPKLGGKAGKEGR